MRTPSSAIRAALFAPVWFTPAQRELAGELVHYLQLEHRKTNNQAKEITRLSEDRTQLKAALTRIADPACDNRQELARLTLAWLENKNEAHPI